MTVERVLADPIERGGALVTLVRLAARPEWDLWPCHGRLPRPTVKAVPGAVRSLEELSRSECVALIGAARVGRAVFTVGALPAVVPVTYSLQGDSVVVCTDADTRLAGVAGQGVLAFEVDDVDPLTRTGWSVVVIGLAERVTDPAERASIHGVVAPWLPGHHDVFIRLPLTMVTGRRIVVSPRSGVAGVGRRLG